MSKRLLILPCAHFIPDSGDGNQPLPSSCPTCHTAFPHLDASPHLVVTFDGPAPCNAITSLAPETYVVCRDCEERRCTVWCEECEGGMAYCAECCDRAHTTRRQQQHHRTDLKSRGVIQCRHHRGERYVVYCRDCRAGLCAKCVATMGLHGAHEGHTLLPITEAGEVIASHVTARQDHLLAMDARCRAIAAAITQELQNMHHSHSAERGAIETARAALHTAVDKRMDAIKDGLDQYVATLLEEQYHNPMRLVSVYRAKLNGYLCLLTELLSRPVDVQAHAEAAILESSGEVDGFHLPVVTPSTAVHVVPAESLWTGATGTDDVSMALEAIRSVGFAYTEGGAVPNGSPALTGSPPEDQYASAYPPLLLVHGGAMPSVTPVAYQMQRWAQRYESALVGLCANMVSHGAGAN